MDTATAPFRARHTMSGKAAHGEQGCLADLAASMILLVLSGLAAFADFEL